MLLRKGWINVVGCLPLEGISCTPDVSGFRPILHPPRLESGLRRCTKNPPQLGNEGKIPEYFVRHFRITYPNHLTYEGNGKRCVHGGDARSRNRASVVTRGIAVTLGLVPVGRFTLGLLRLM